MPRLARTLAVVLLGLVSTASLARAEQVVNKTIGIGFHSPAEPIGGRWWFADPLGLDVGFGFGAEKVVTDIDTNGDFFDDTRVTDTLGRWSVAIGMPWTAWRWESVRVNLVPGVAYRAEDDFGSFLDTGGRVKLNTLEASGEFEIEVPIVTNITLSASTGVVFRTRKLDLSSAEREWSFDSVGQDFTEIGFHAYLWGPKTTP